MSDPGYYGQQELDTQNTSFNRLAFVIAMFINRINTATLVQVQAVNSDAMTVDVLPLVAQTAGDGSTIPHGTIYGLPFLRLQGGVNAVICDPQVDDIGLVVFADHDLSSVKNTNAAAPPGSYRRFDMADGVYIGGWNVTNTPTRLLKLANGGMVLEAPEAVYVKAPAVNTDTAYQVGGIQVVGAQQANIAAPTGGGTIDAQARVTINSILSVLQTHGLIS